ncbi:hypothetical protein jhhlp_000953 [Lomentospora prolificans]|uniref:SnoaL-like domain-containing protein n=1 Tax=Lomentospora prolificans TaxID=41688 RepID=A0A2N3NJW9_9PEZI|nr:hypothetical protein jhhlp_000953 [Lomentospora prolificans]
MSDPATAHPPVPLPSAPAVQLAPNVSLQPPLSRRGHGPGLVVIDPGYEVADKPSAEPPSETLDPAPQYKWAEEGYAVVRLVVSKGASEGSWNLKEGALQKVIDALIKLEECDIKDKFALLVYGSPDEYPSEFHGYLSSALAAFQSLVSIVAFSSDWNFSSASKPVLIHQAGKGVAPTGTAGVKAYTYPNATSPSFIIPGSKEFSYTAASVAHSRSLKFIKDHLGGPIFDLEKIWDEHTYYEFADRSVEQTMGTMVLEPYVNHIPTMTGGIGRERLANFYRHHFIFNNPEDTELELVSRTIGVDRIVDEFIFVLTHNKVVDWLIPGIPPTGVTLRIPFVAVVNIRGDRLYHEHITWDQGTVLKQLGLLPEYLPFPYAVQGQEGKKLEVKVPVAGVETAKKLEDQRSVESNSMIVSTATSLREVNVNVDT